MLRATLPTGLPFKGNAIKPTKIKPKMSYNFETDNLVKSRIIKDFKSYRIIN